MPAPPPRKQAISIVPDWICEILSSSTASYDNIVKRRLYAEIGVAHIWYIDPLRKQLEACRLVEGKWLQLDVFWGDEKVRAEPLESIEIEIEMSEWWEGIEEEEE